MMATIAQTPGKQKTHDGCIWWQRKATQCCRTVRLTRH